MQISLTTPCAKVRIIPKLNFLTVSLGIYSVSIKTIMIPKVCIYISLVVIRVEDLYSQLVNRVANYQLFAFYRCSV